MTTNVTKAAGVPQAAGSARHEAGVPVVYLYIADAHDNHQYPGAPANPDGTFGPGEAGYVFPQEEGPLQVYYRGHSTQRQVTHRCLRNTYRRKRHD